MSQLLKDCQRDENLFDTIDLLGKKIEKINSFKERSKELNKMKKEIKSETDEALKKVKEEFLILLDKFNREKWIIGEYKWMPVGSLMPEGWIKIELAEGQTLVQGFKEGKTEGKLQKHSHIFHSGYSSWSVRNIYYGTGRLDGATDVMFPYVKTADDAEVFDTVVETGSQKENLAAGIYAELWQYKGIDYKKEYIKK